MRQHFINPHSIVNVVKWEVHGYLFSGNELGCLKARALRPRSEGPRTSETAGSAISVHLSFRGNQKERRCNKYISSPVFFNT